MQDNKEDKENPQVFEYEGTTVEAAIKKALGELRVSRDRIRLQILTEGKRGLFGMEGAKKAKIRITLAPEEKTP